LADAGWLMMSVFWYVFLIKSALSNLKKSIWEGKRDLKKDFFFKLSKIKKKAGIFLLDTDTHTVSDMLMTSRNWKPFLK
jgi:hypothetical protein